MYCYYNTYPYISQDTIDLDTVNFSVTNNYTEEGQPYRYPLYIVARGLYYSFNNANNTFGNTQTYQVPAQETVNFSIPNTLDESWFRGYLTAIEIEIRGFNNIKKFACAFPTTSMKAAYTVQEIRSCRGGLQIDVR